MPEQSIEEVKECIEVAKTTEQQVITVESLGEANLFHQTKSVAFDISIEHHTGKSEAGGESPLTKRRAAKEGPLFRGSVYKYQHGFQTDFVARYLVLTDSELKYYRSWAQLNNRIASNKPLISVPLQLIWKVRPFKYVEPNRPEGSGIRMSSTDKAQKQKSLYRNMFEVVLLTKERISAVKPSTVPQLEKGSSPFFGSRV